MNRKRLAVAALLSLCALSTAACDMGEESLGTELDTDDIELRDLSPSYQNTNVLIQNIDNRTCLAFDPNASSFPLEVPCDGSDPTQHFVFDVQTFVGGVGFIYKVCSADNPSVCLMHETTGIAAFVDEAQLPALGGSWFDQIRVQHDEDKAFIEFRYSGQCLTPGDPPTAQSCDWFGSTEQQYRLLSDCSVWDQDCSDGEKCVPYATEGDSVWNANLCVPLEADRGQPGDPCTVNSDGSGRDSCDVSSTCFYVSPDTGEGICTAFCTGSVSAPVCDDPTTTCVNFDGGFAALCLESCDPLSQNCSGSEQVCEFAPSSDSFVCLPDLLPNDTGVYGASCGSDDACNPGLFCGAQNTVPGCTNPGGCCSDFCDLSDLYANGNCSGVLVGQKCQPWWENASPPPGYEHVGFCGVP